MRIRSFVFIGGRKFRKIETTLYVFNRGGFCQKRGQRASKAFSVLFVWHIFFLSDFKAVLENCAFLSFKLYAVFCCHLVATALKKRHPRILFNEGIVVLGQPCRLVVMVII